MSTRREFLAQAGLTAAGLLYAGPAAAAPAGRVHVVTVHSNVQGSEVYFDPIGLLIQPGDTIRWVLDMANSHSTTAYHPQNSRHSRRIPDGATPWNSDYMTDKGQHFEVKLTVPGVYDYFCIPHEAMGMVGRIVVGHPAGPGTLPFDYYKGKPEAHNWKPVPEAAQKAFPTLEKILRDKTVRHS